MKTIIIDKTNDLSLGRVGSYHLESGLFLLNALIEKEYQVANNRDIYNTGLISALYLIYQGTENYLKNIIFYITINNDTDLHAIKTIHNLHDLIKEVKSRAIKFKTKEQQKKINEYLEWINKNIIIFKDIHKDLDTAHQLIRFGTNIKESIKVKPEFLNLTQKNNRKADFNKLYEKVIYLCGALEELNIFVKNNVKKLNKSFDNTTKGRL